MAESNACVFSTATLRAIQVASGAAFGVSFMAGHLVTIAFGGSSGPDAFDGILAVTRRTYRFTNLRKCGLVIEGAIVAVLPLIHVAASVAIMRRRAGRVFAIQNKKKHMPLLSVKPVEGGIWREVSSAVGAECQILIRACRYYVFGFVKNTDQSSLLNEKSLPVESVEGALHRIAGYIVALSLSAHVFAVRVLPALVGAPDGDFSLIRFSLKEWPVIFYPYYAVFGAAGVVHFSFGARRAWQYFRPTSLTPASHVVADIRSSAAMGLQNISDRLFSPPESPKSSRRIGTLQIGVAGGVVLMFAAVLRLGGIWGADFVARSDHVRWQNEYERLWDVLPLPGGFVRRLALPWTR